MNGNGGFVGGYLNQGILKELTSATIRCYPINHEETKQSINDKNDGKFAIFSKAY